MVEAVAGRCVFPPVLPDLAYDDDFVPDLVFPGNYPSKEAVFDLVTNPAYAEWPKSERLRSNGRPLPSCGCPERKVIPGISRLNTVHLPTTSLYLGCLRH